MIIYNLHAAAACDWGRGLILESSSLLRRHQFRFKLLLRLFRAVFDLADLDEAMVHHHRFQCWLGLLPDYVRYHRSSRRGPRTSEASWDWSHPLGILWTSGREFCWGRIGWDDGFCWCGGLQPCPASSRCAGTGRPRRRAGRPSSSASCSSPCTFVDTLLDASERGRSEYDLNKCYFRYARQFI